MERSFKYSAYWNIWFPSPPDILMIFMVFTSYLLHKADLLFYHTFPVTTSFCESARIDRTGNHDYNKTIYIMPCGIANYQRTDAK